jgi:demethylmenaquinone methyltransferase/2-methoxy-6-polyprenyl-1,4-benzoquinol methylase
VLQPRGRLCLLEITQPERALSRVLFKAYLRGFIPIAATLVSRHPDMAQLMRYYWDTIAACVPPATIIKSLQAAGFIDVDRRVSMGVFSEYRANKPG